MEDWVVQGFISCAKEFRSNTMVAQALSQETLNLIWGLGICILIKLPRVKYICLQHALKRIKKIKWLEGWMEG